jgi:hypothetical protein
MRHFSIKEDHCACLWVVVWLMSANSTPIIRSIYGIFLILLSLNSSMGLLTTFYLIWMCFWISYMSRIRSLFISFAQKWIRGVQSSTVSFIDMCRVDELSRRRLMFWVFFWRIFGFRCRFSNWSFIINNGWYSDTWLL